MSVSMARLRPGKCIWTSMIASMIWNDLGNVGIRANVCQLISQREQNHHQIHLSGTAESLRGWRWQFAQTHHYGWDVMSPKQAGVLTRFNGISTWDLPSKKQLKTKSSAEEDDVKYLNRKSSVSLEPKWKSLFTITSRGWRSWRPELQDKT